MTAIFCRIHIPTIMLALLIVNPLTIVPLYLLAYKIGVIVTGAPQLPFAFRDELGLGAARAGPDVETVPRRLRRHGSAVRPLGICAARLAVAL